MKTIKLPGEITLKPDDVVHVNPNRRSIATVPFTVREIHALIDKHVKMVNGVPHITVKNNKLVALARYVAELNLWEHYLNRFGYTLRDRALALPQRAGIRPVPIIRGDNFGPILKLREPAGVTIPVPIQTPDKLVDKRTKPPLFDYGIVEDAYAAVINPNIRGRETSPSAASPGAAFTSNESRESKGRFSAV